MSTYELSFAGVPFVTDTAQQINSPGEVCKELPLQRPEVDLVDELNRIIPFHYINELSYPGSYPGRNVSSLAGQVNSRPDPVSQVRIGEWYYPPGASRWSVFRGLATSSQVKAMLAATGGSSPGTFVLSSYPNIDSSPLSSYRLESELYLMPPRPLAEHGGKLDGLFLVTLVDERYYFGGSPVSLKIGRDTTWSLLLTQLAQTLSINLAIPDISSAYGKPEADSQLWSSFESASTLLDAVCSNIGATLVRNLDGTYNIYTPTQSKAIVNTNRGSANNIIRTAGGDLFSTTPLLPAGNLTDAKNAVVPSSIFVAFPKYVTGNDPVPHFLNSRNAPPRPSSWFEDSFGDSYSIEVPITSGGSFVTGLTGVSTQVIRCNAKALLDSESDITPTNLAGLTTLAIQLAQDRYNALVATALDEVYPGIYAWTPEGIHSIIWTYSTRSRQATTRVVHPPWTETVSEGQQATPAASGGNGQDSWPRGAGGHSVAQTVRDTTRQAVVPLGASLTSGGMSVTLAHSDCLPTQNRWRAKIDDEVLLLEGTGGGPLATVVYRGIDGTAQTAHNSGATLTRLSTQATYGVNLVTHEKMVYTHPKEWTSGGITGVVVKPQTQSVQVLDSIGCYIYGNLFYSGLLWEYDPTQNGWIPGENVWLSDRNNAIPVKGVRYDGQFAGYSAGSISGTVTLSGGIGTGPVTPAPVYLISQQPATSGGNCKNVEVYETDVRCEQGSLNVYQRVVQLRISGGCLVREPGAEWVLLRTEGCCSCSGQIVSGGLVSGGTGCVAGSCGLCDDTPYSWSVPINGFIGTCEVFNRGWNLQGAGAYTSCSWSESIDVGGIPVSVTLSLDASSYTLNLDYGDYGATYTALSTGTDCCQVVNLTLDNASCACDDPIFNLSGTISGSTSGGSTIDCASCLYTTPATWTLTTLSSPGAPGCYSDLNGIFTLFQGTNYCQWGSPGAGTTVHAALTITNLSNGVQYQASLFDSATGALAQYLFVDGAKPSDCCSPKTLSLVSAVCPNPTLGGIAPHSVTVTPSCTVGGGLHIAGSSGCIDSISATPFCCSGIGGLSGGFSGGLFSGGFSSGGGLSSGASHATSCCPGYLLPDTLYLTFTAGGNACLTGTTYPMAYALLGIDASWASDPNAWIGKLCGTAENIINLTCATLTTNWSINCATTGGDSCFAGPPHIDAVQCTPFFLAGTIALDSLCGSGNTASFVITE